MATLEQARARFALERVHSVRGGPQAGEYKSDLVKLPARLHNNGLGQTVAFYLSAGGDSPEATICGWLGDWLSREGQPYEDLRDDQSLIDWITGHHPAFEGAGDDAEVLYRRASAEARALATWLKRFAEAFIGEAATDA
jgi:CRISPR-associated protein Cmr5